jgi:F-type H+-transporting ATPase subunit b
MLLTMANFLFLPSGLTETSAQGGFLDTLPDPMKLEWQTVLFVIVLVTLLYIFLKGAFFKPVMTIMDEREVAIAAGANAKAEAATRIESSQAKYAEALKGLRAKAFEHRKALASAVARERQTILDQAREQAVSQRQAALLDLKNQTDAAKTQLMAQVETLAESMARQLLRNA